MLKMKVTYSTEQEFEKLKRVLGKNITKIHIPKKEDSKQIKKAYIFFK